MTAAHAASIVQRDIKPENIMMRWLCEGVGFWLGQAHRTSACQSFAAKESLDVRKINTQRSLE